MIKRIGMLTSGGDCQALNATMRGVVKGLSNSVDELEVYGFVEHLEIMGLRQKRKKH